MKKGFRQMLKERQEKVSSLVCVGLDPVPEKTPECIKGKNLWSRIAVHLMKIVDATASYALIFKPQKAHYEAFPDGQKTLQFIVDHIHNKYPDIPVFLDCKRGDIDRTQQRYRIAHFEIDGIDGMNFSPYMGKDCMAKLIDKDNLGRSIVGLCRTSNPDAWEIQDVILKDGRKYWEYVAERVLEWSEEFGITSDAGLVMGAAHSGKKIEEKLGSWQCPELFAYAREDFEGIYSKHLSRVRQIVGTDLWFLIPGIGAQGGFIEETVRTAYAGPGSIAINSSSGITQASLGKDFADAAALKAKGLRDQINEALGTEGIA